LSRNSLSKAAVCQFSFTDIVFPRILWKSSAVRVQSFTRVPGLVLLGFQRLIEHLVFKGLQTDSVWSDRERVVAPHPR
jgi:hypothetical protein